MCRLESQKLYKSKRLMHWSRQSRSSFQEAELQLYCACTVQFYTYWGIRHAIQNKEQKIAEQRRIRTKTTARKLIANTYRRHLHDPQLGPDNPPAAACRPPTRRRGRHQPPARRRGRTGPSARRRGRGGAAPRRGARRAEPAAAAPAANLFRQRRAEWTTQLIYKQAWW